MSSLDYTNPYKHPGSGGARKYPPNGGADWYPLPDGTWQTVEHCTTEQVARTGPLSGLRDKVLPPKTVTTCTTEVRKNYK